MSGKRAARDEATTDGDEEPQEERNVKPRLSARDQMQLKLLASIPSLQQAPLRDRTGRRRATCVSSDEMAEGLANLVASHTALAADSEGKSGSTPQSDLLDTAAEEVASAPADVLHSTSLASRSPSMCVDSADRVAALAEDEERTAK